jgi:RNA polymerase sigma-70 factor (ECF subfamily)
MLALLGAVFAPKPDADDELLTRIASGDQRALRKLYDRCAGQCLALAVRIVRERREAEEVVQEAFLEVWKRAGDFDGRRGSAVAWLMQIARTRAIDRLRTRGAVDRMVSRAAHEPEPPPAPAALELVEARRRRDRVKSALDRLPENQRACIELAYFEGLTQREIAERTGDPLGTVKTRVRTALQRLATLLDEEAA